MENLRVLDGNNAGVEANQSGLGSIDRYQWFTIVVLCFVNLINYMDRFTIAGVLSDVQLDFEIDNDSAGLLQTAFIVSYMIFAPLFGYLGDRYSRRYLMIVGISLWSTTTLLGSFMHEFGWFIAFRAMVGIGEASYTTIAPTIISDLFVHNLRSKMLALFYFAIPVGSGLGYIVGSKTAHLANNWRWALRVTPILGVAAVLLIILIKEPKRGESEGSENMSTTSYLVDIKQLCKNYSFMLSTAGFTCVAFVAGALSWWGPTYIHLGLKLQPENENLEVDDVAFKFGLITMIAGLLGVPLGSFLSQYLKKRFPSVDPVICAVGLLLSAPLITVALLIVSRYTAATYILVFFGQLTLNLNWAVVADILLYVVVPTRRSTAEAFQILIAHALGDAGSPYLVGAISVALKDHLSETSSKILSKRSLQTMTQVLKNITETSGDLQFGAKSAAVFPLPKTHATDEVVSFKALQYSLFSTTIVELLGGIFFLVTACFVVMDKQKATEAAVESHTEQSPQRNR